MILITTKLDSIYFIFRYIITAAIHHGGRDVSSLELLVRVRVVDNDNHPFHANHGQGEHRQLTAERDQKTSNLRKSC